MYLLIFMHEGKLTNFGTAVFLIILLDILLIFLLMQIYIRYLHKKIEYEKDFINNILNNFNIIVIVMKMDGTIVQFNKFAATVMMLMEEQSHGKNLKSVRISITASNSVKHIFDMITNNEPVQNYEENLVTPDGEQMYILWNSSIHPMGKEDIFIILTGVDITERKKAEKQLKESYGQLEVIHKELIATQLEIQQNYNELKKNQEALRISEERYRLVIEGSNDGIWDLDIPNKKIFISERGKAILATDENLTSFNMDYLKSLIYLEDSNLFLNHIHEYLIKNDSNLFFSHEMRVMAKDECKWIQIRARTVWDEDGNPIRLAGSFTDITERRQSEEKIHNMAYFDPLTGLANRTMFVDRLNFAIEQARRKNLMIAIFFMDLDNFKTINDSLGHTFGDKLLKNIGSVLKKCLRKNDSVARLAGDEFIFLQPQVNDIQEIICVAERVLNIFQKPWSQEGHDFYITASIGVTLFPDDGGDIDTLLKNADTAMYRAKELGKNNYQLFTRKMNAQIIERLGMENSLRHAVERRQFVIHYQPQIDLKTCKIIGNEALVRWIHPVMGLVSPLKFIPLAEEVGLIIPIGEWVLRTACTQNKLWQESGHNKLSIAVNLSARQFQQQDLVSMIDGILEETGLEPQYLELEITESTAMKDMDHTIAILHELRKMGIKVSLDDFGTGYSSLNYLKMLPINTLKIDKSFINDIAMESKESAIARAVITLAHIMKLLVDAEGVETMEQFNILKKEKCDRAQGFLFSRPLPAQEVNDLLKQGYISLKSDRDDHNI